MPEQGLPGAVPAGGQPRQGVHVSQRHAGLPRNTKMVGLLSELQKDGARAVRSTCGQTPSTRPREAGRASLRVASRSPCFTSLRVAVDDFDLAVPGCASGPHWTGEGDPPQIEEIISMSEEGRPRLAFVKCAYCE